VQAVLNAVSQLRIKNVIEASEVGSNQEIYGLAPPELVLTLEGSFGKKVASFGKKVQLSGRRYFQPEHDGRIFLVDDAVFSQLNISADDIRNHRPVDFNVNAAEEVSLIRGHDDSISFEQHDGAWKAKYSGGEFDADSELIQKALQDLKNIRVKKFVDEPDASLALYGLAQPRLIVSIRVGDQPEYLLQFGEGVSVDPAISKNPQSSTPTVTLSPSKGYYFKIKGRPFIYELATPVYSDLLRGYEYFRPRSPWSSLKLEDIVRIEIENGENKAAAYARSGGTPAGVWQSELQQPTGSPAPDEAVAKISKAARALHVLTYYPQTDAALPESGLQQPRQRLKIFLKDRESPLLLVIGNDVQESEPPGKQAREEQPEPQSPHWIAISQTDGTLLPAVMNAEEFEEISRSLPPYS
jgi:hypothetical protein